MKIRNIQLFNKFDALIIDKFYEDNELRRISSEIEFLEPKLGDESKTNAATEAGPYGVRRKKRGRGVFLDEVYTDRRFSTILMLSRKLFHNPEIRSFIEELATGNLYWRQWKHVNFDSTLLQTYANGDYYDYHIDQSQFTAITTLKFDDAAYSGGNLWFKEGKEEVEFQAAHNSIILFPSVIDHRVQEIVYNKPPETILDQRWSISHLISSR